MGFALEKGERMRKSVKSVGHIAHRYSARLVTLMPWMSCTMPACPDKLATRSYAHQAFDTIVILGRVCG
eukprot:scaffold45719_cov26-Tisochrysis_lutea.AAC.4